jgi:GPN-loop GTPase
MSNESPTVIFIIGMAGSGKSTYIAQLQQQLLSSNKSVFMINLDPAVLSDTLHYSPNIDIRDSIKYQDVMSEYALGPNGAILTCLNLYVTKFDQLLNILETTSCDYILIDTPGQIEVFNWSISGQIIADSLSIKYKTAIHYILDGYKCNQSAITFISNMVYALSIKTKYQLPFQLIVNKMDTITGQNNILAWGSEFDILLEAISDEGQRDQGSFMSSLARSMVLSLEEFYVNMNRCFVSSYTAMGFSEVIEKLPGLEKEYEKDFLPFLERRKNEVNQKREAIVKENMEKMEKLESGKVPVVAKHAVRRTSKEAEESEDEEEDRRELEKLRKILKK